VVVVEVAFEAVCEKAGAMKRSTAKDILRIEEDLIII